MECVHTVPAFPAFSNTSSIVPAKKAKERAEERLNQKNLSDREQRIAEAKLRRALVRLHVTNEE